MRVESLEIIIKTTNMTMRKFFVTLWLSLLVAGAWAGEYDKYYVELPTEVAQVTVPEIPQNVVRLTDCGGKGDGVTLNTEAFKEATKRLTAMGGGKIVVGDGV